MRIALVDNGTTLLKKLQHLIPGDEVVFANTCDGLQEDDFDVLILSGSSHGPLYGNESIYQDELETVQKRQKHTIGICFGCELIAHAYGMPLEEMEQQEQGLCEYRVVSDESCFGGRESFQAYENHKWRIQQVHKPFKTLATSEHGPAVIRHQNLPIYGLQFHPEHLVEQSFGDEIFRNLIGIKPS